MPKKKASRTTKTTKRKASTRTQTHATQVVAERKNPSMVQNLASGHFSFTQLVMLFVALFIINSLVFYLANLLFPANVVLGTHVIDQWTALFSSMLILSAIDVGATPLIEMISDMFRLRLGMREWTILYFVLNAVAIWFIARMAEMIGLGISSWLVVVILAIVLDLLQGMAAGFVSTLRPNRGA